MDYKKVNTLMKYKGFSKLRLSRETGIAPQDISSVLNGKRYCYPGWKRRIAEALGVTEDDISDSEMK